jgi:hypothetical protein
MPDRRFDLIELEADLAELILYLADLRPFPEQFLQQRPGRQILPGRHQSVDKIGARRPMRGVQLQSLKIKRDGFSDPASLEMHIGEIAPAGREMRSQLQRGPVVPGC